MNELLCPWEGAQYLIYSSNVPALLYYSHIPAIIVALSFVILMLRKSRRSQMTVSLSVMLVLFSIWVFADLILWATNRPDVTMFFWSMQILLEVLIYASAFLASYLFIAGKAISRSSTYVFFALLAIFVALIPTRFNLTGVALETCFAQESVLIIYFSYILEMLFSIGIITTAFSSWKIQTFERRGQIVYYTIGIIIFLLAMTYGNVVGSFSDNWVLAQYGLFGMPIFIGFLAYMIVKFKTFDIKLVGAQALIISLVVLIGSQFFFIQTDTNRILTAITLIITGAIGLNLVRSVKKEVALREQIEKQEKELEIANERLKELDQLKSEFVSLATHQIRGPLTAIKGYASLIIEGDYGEVPKELKEPIDTIFQSTQSLVVIVEDFLNVSRMEQGKMKYDLSTFDVGLLTKEVVTEMKPVIEKKGLAISLDVSDDAVNVNGDRGKIKQIIGNLLDNSIKYTPKGRLDVAVRPNASAGVVTVSIKDTGVGIKPQTLPHLFQKFSRAEDASKFNILGTGLGLYVAKQMITAQGGRVWAESEGEGKGSTFFVELKLA